MLVPYFGPQTHAAMFRSHKLAKYLPAHGFKPIVVTTDKNYLYNDDPQILNELPSDVEIHRARYIEPTLRGIRMALGGKDRTFSAVKNEKRLDIAGDRSSSRTNWLGGWNIGGMVSQILGDFPDRHWPWSAPAYRLGSKLIAERRIRLMYTSANPVSFLRAANRLRRKHDIRWLFDARDPLGYGQKHCSESQIAILQERAILRRSMDLADHVTGLASTYGQIFFDLYGLPGEKYSFIPTGLDESYLDGLSPKTREAFLLHVGEVMPDQSKYAFQVLDRLLSLHGGVDTFDQIIFVGRREINEPRVKTLTAGMPHLQSRLSFVDHCPQTAVYDLVRRAKACLLVPGAERYWWTNFAKLCDYICLGAPVIAHVPAISEARRELEKAETAFFLQGDCSYDSAQLTAWLNNSDAILPLKYAERYTAKRQAADFAGVLRKISNSF